MDVADISSALPLAVQVSGGRQPACYQESRGGWDGSRWLVAHGGSRVAAHGMEAHSGYGAVRCAGDAGAGPGHG